MTVSKYWKWAFWVLIAHMVFAVVGWFFLPSRIPMHFGPTGVADAWTHKTPLAWFGLVGGSLFIYLLIYVLSRPEAMAGWNIPEKSRFEKLTSAQQSPVLAVMSLFGAATAGSVILMFLTLHFGMLLAAHGIRGGGLSWYIILVLVAVPVGILLGLIPWSAAVKRAIISAESTADSR